MPDTDITNRMKEDWNERAREDASYYVAFGRKQQTAEEFFATAEEVVRGLRWELQRLPASQRGRALEIGCGPGRLIRPMSQDFGSIDGIDVSDEMIERARANLADVPNARVEAGDGATLAPFSDAAYDFVYSYAVFQHIPSKNVVLDYLREASRVLKPGGILRAQFSGLPERDVTDTWSGVRFTSQELVSFTREHGFQVLAIEGANTQYMWMTWRKRLKEWRSTLPEMAALTE